MRRSMPVALVLGLALSLSAGLAAVAHEGSGEAKVQVEPAAVTAGETVVLAGSGLEPDSDRVLVLVGGDLTVALGIVKTDAEGMFSQALTIPAHLPSGTFELQAIGDETLTTPLSVTAAAGGAAATSGPPDAGSTIMPRERPQIELALIIVLIAMVIGVGGWLAWRAERFGGSHPA
ncbi:MAG: hypothetical protein ABI555_07385 [Chloroflexota bacterium]